MKVQLIHHNMAICSAHGQDTTVAFIPGGRVILFNDKVSQVFRVPGSTETLDEAARELKTREGIEAAAEYYREGHTNKDRFLASAADLLKTRKITEGDFNRLRSLIVHCHCSPSKIRSKLAGIGYGHLDLAFEDKDPRLETTVALMWRLVEYLKMNI